MERQALPSIFLSVSIVCFFAVALYQRDGEPRNVVSRKGVRTANPTAPEISPQVAALADRGSAGASPDDASRKSGPSASVPVGAMMGEPAPRAARPDRPLRRTARTHPTDEPPRPPVRGATNRAGRDASSTHPAGERTESTPRRRTVDRLARAPFTVVGSGESIADVARRVYGTADDAGILWKANRDVLSAPDAVIEPGTVLRTPAAPLR